MQPRCVVAAALVLLAPVDCYADFHNQGTRPGITKSFDCEARRHAYEFAKATLPERGSFRTAFEALQLQACGMSTPAEYDTYRPPSFATPSSGALIFADPTAAGGGDGSKGAPFNSLEAAVGAASMPGQKTILLRAGTYHTTGVVLTPAHSELTIQNYEGEAVVISGALPIGNSKRRWSLVDRQTNLWKLDLAGQDMGVEYGMRVGGRRAVRAKYPNGDPETAPTYAQAPYNISFAPYLNGSGISETLPKYFPRQHESENKTVDYWAHPADWPGVFWHDADGVHPQSLGGYGPYFYASGGACSGRTPSHGYWCSQSNPRAAMGQHHHDPPGGFEFKDALPQAGAYKRPAGAIFHARGGSMPYFTLMCLVSGVSDGKVHFDPSVGCDQGGPTQPGAAWDWFIENVREECDAPNEYFYDAAEGSLYYVFNGTDAPSGEEQLAFTRTKVLINISGSQASPVRRVTIQGLSLRDAAYTYLGTSEADRHWLPSEGDWALQRSGAISIEGAEDVAVHRNEISRCDGNGVFLGGYTRRVNLTGNEMSWLGGSAMAAFGWTSDCLNANCTARLPAKVGPDGRGGEQPRGTYVAGNLVREIGIWQKQSSAWFQALATTSLIECNVFFNGPRAAINFNDAFGGGDEVRGNLMFNMVRETVDHGVINAWERGPYISDLGYVPAARPALTPTAAEIATGATPGFEVDTSGRGSVVSLYRRLHGNMVLGTYSVHAVLETDDGTSRTLQYGNYFTHMMSATDFAVNAHYLYQVNSVYAYPSFIMWGWHHGVPPYNTAPPATDCYVYNSTFFMLGSQVCGNNFNTSVLDGSTVHSEAPPRPGECQQGGATLRPGVKFAPPAPDAAVTAAAKAVLGEYPRPYHQL